VKPQDREVSLLWGCIRFTLREPDRIIGVDYLHRWHIIPRNPFLNIMVHRFVGSDDDRALHDHPWWSLSFLLKGCLCEWVGREDLGKGFRQWHIVPRFLPVFRKATHAHALELISREPAWTLFITGPVIRPWYFHCPQGLVHHKQFTDATGNGIGKGCDQ